MRKKTMHAFFCILLMLLLLNSHVQAQKDSTVTSDNMYGRGGRNVLITEKTALGTITTEKVYDANKVLRMYKSESVYDDGSRVDVLNYYDCKGDPIYTKEVNTGKTGREISFRETIWKNNKMVAGTERDVDEAGKNHKMRYDPVSKKWEEVDESYSDPSLPIGNYQPDVESCSPPDDAFPGSEIYIGPSVILEDSKPKSFGTYGASVEYMHPIGHTLGLKAKAGFNIGSNGGVDYRKFSVLGGLTAFPFSGANRNDKFIFSVDIMGGYANLNSDFGPVSATTSGFTALAGVNLDLKLNRNIAARLLQADYNPTFFNGHTANNFFFSAGLLWRFKKQGR